MIICFVSAAVGCVSFSRWILRGQCLCVLSVQRCGILGMISMRPIEWERMSWYARQRWLKRNRGAAGSVVPDSVPVPVRDQPVIRVSVEPVLPEPERCGKCGAWMFDECGTDHGRRYAL